MRKTFILSFVITLFGLFAFNTLQKPSKKEIANTYVAIPDANFESALNALGYDDIPGDGQVPIANINTVTTLDVSSKSISDLTGIAAFTALEDLNCESNSLTSLDVSSNINLKTLNFDNNTVASLNLGANSNLNSIEGRYNQLTTIDLSQVPNVTFMNIRNNLFVSVDVSNNILLSTLNLRGCSSLTSLDISNNTELAFLYLQDTALNGLDVASNTKLEVLIIERVNFSSIDVSNLSLLKQLRIGDNNFTELDVSNNPALERLECENNSLTYLNLKNGNNTIITNGNFIATGNPSLSCIEVDDPTWSTTNWTNIDNTTSFNSYCRYTTISDANFESALNTLGYDDIAGDGQVPTELIEIVTDLDVNSQSISSLSGIEDFKALENLTCNANSISSLDVSQNTNLKFLKCNNNNMTSLTLGSLSELEDVLAYSNNLTSLDCTSLTSLDRINVSFNSITSLDLSQNSALTFIRVDSNNLSFLNVRNGNNSNVTTFDSSTNASLSCVTVDSVTYSNSNWTSKNGITKFSETLYCEYITIPDANFESRLEALGYDDISGDGQVPEDLITSVTSLDVSGQNISSLSGIENFDALSILNASNNLLNTLDLSVLTNLTSVNLSLNLLTQLNIRNGVNTNITSFDITNNANVCVFVDDKDYSTTNWANIDSNGGFTETSYCKYTLIPDSNFEAELEALGYDDISGDGQVPTELIDVVTSLNISNQSITDVTGIEDFQLLSTLNVSNNTISSIDLSELQNLTAVNASSNSLTYFDIRNDFNTNITAFDLTNNSGLTCVFVDDPSYATSNWTQIDGTASFVSDYLDCGYVEIPDVNFENELIAQGYDTVQDGLVLLSSVENITHLNINNKGISDLSGIEYFAELVDLSCKDNNLTVLNLRYNTKLIALNCVRNDIVGLNLDYNINLSALNCAANDLRSLSLRNGVNSSHGQFNAINNDNLTCITVDDAAYSTANWNGIDDHAVFSETNCGYTLIPDPNFETALFELGLDDAKEDGKVPTDNINTLVSLDVSSRDISDLTGISDFTALQELNISGNEISALDLTLNTSITRLNASSNNLESLNIRNGNNTNILEFDTTSNDNLFCVLVDDATYSSSNWMTIDSQTDFTNTSYCNYAAVPNIVFENYLESLGYDDTSSDGQVPTDLIKDITELDVSGKGISDLTGIEDFKALEKLDVSNNNLISLDVNGLSLKSLSVSGNSGLTTLVCNNNDLRALDLTSNVSLTTILANDNNLSFLNLKNGNNAAISAINITNNSNLTCVLVEDASAATTSWTNKDVQTQYSDTYCTFAHYNFASNLEDSTGSYTASYVFEQAVALETNASYLATSSGMGIQSKPNEGVQLPVDITPFLFTDDSVEFEMNFICTDLGAEDGRKNLFTLKRYESLNAAGFTLWAEATSASEFTLGLYWNDEDSLGGGGEGINLGTFAIGEEVHTRLIIDRSQREWYLYANNYFNYGAFRDVYDLDYLINQIQNTPVYLGDFYSKIGNLVSTVVIDDFSIHIPAKPSDVDLLESALSQMTDHILGNITLTSEQTKDYEFDILSNLRYNYLNARTEVDNYLTAFEDNFDPLFQDRTKVNVFDLSSEQIIAFFLQQDIIDNAFTSDNVDNVIGTKFKFSEIYPGPVADGAPRITDGIIPINSTYQLDPGYELMGQDKGVYRPTGYYAAPGELVTVTVPSSIVGQGFEVIVGAPSRDLYSVSKINRYHRISTEFEITSETTKVGNPLGGVIYIKVPAEVNFGWVDFTFNGAVKSPYFRMVTGQSTNLAEFQNDMANAYVNWVDMESDRMMFLIPRDLVDVSDPTEIMNTWNSMWDAFSTAAGRPVDKIRPEYWLVDCGGINNAAGYPSDIEFESYQGTTRDLTWNPLRVMDDDYITNYPSTIFHEMGHTMLLPEPSGEAEAIIQLCGAPMLVSALGFDIDEVLLILDNQKHDRDLAAMYWMTAYNFRNNQPMKCDPTLDSSVCDEISYQIRGAMKWHEIASLYDYETLGEIQKVFYDEWAKNGTNDPSNPNSITREELIRAATEATGINLTPLLHFWGYIPDTEIQQEFDDFAPSTEFCDRLEYYRSLIPRTQAEYKTWHDALIATTNSNHFDRLTDIYDNWETEDISGQILAQIDYLAGLYCDKTTVESKVFLQGTAINPNTGEESLMRDDLRVGGHLPNTSPYEDAVIYDASVFDVTGDNAIVDWVWVELRDASDVNTVIKGKSAVLQRDGDIVEMVNGKERSLFFNVAAGDYYVAVNHRNHLGIITANPITLSVTPNKLDLSNDANSINEGTNAVVILENGFYALVAGDYDENGQVQNTDINAVISLLGGSGYNKADIDMNGQIQNSDINNLLNPNSGKGQQF
ncbi:M60 family peptidase N-terminal accessory domain-containing protein [uncultured Tenacibaculum sp.]|uniref:M60 family peptidase N-terminal accessory domain-containing protein n=1 Tax=uncultured Tenacibaculum sp. TaxID=174713 RepID=UPI0026302567|nr:M60 family peptidase N-terminal accessory domain-containing protein [uncultured Tenacibaculum sp.]